MDPRCRTSAPEVGASRWSDSLSSISRHELKTRKGTTSGKPGRHKVVRGENELLLSKSAIEAYKYTTIYPIDGP
jgi:hypothetical protein